MRFDFHALSNYRGTRGRHLLARLLLVTLLIIAIYPQAVRGAPTAQASSLPFLVKDINPGIASSEPLYFTDINGTLFFVARDPEHPLALWKSDGTTEGTILVKDIGIGSDMANLDGHLFFLGNGIQLWTSDGTTNGTVPVTSVDTRATGLIAVGHQLFFHSFYQRNSPNKLWRSDGTAAGTVLLKEFASNWLHDYIGALTPVGDLLFFCYRNEIWKSDGTPDGTTPVKVVEVSYRLANLSNFNGTLFFSVDSVLWKSDGTPEGTVPIKDVARTPGEFVYLHDFVDVSGTLMFGAHRRSSDMPLELWKSDGTTAGTELVSEFDAEFLIYPVAIEGWLIGALATESNYGDELWKSDGTRAGTLLVRDINPGVASATPRRMTNVNGKVLFKATDGIHGDELWQSSGTAGGTLLVHDIVSGEGGSSPGQFSGFTVAGGFVFFDADDGSTGRELWALPLSALSNGSYLPLVSR
jgi:ELWxxDGT repeat protein